MACCWRRAAAWSAVALASAVATAHAEDVFDLMAPRPPAEFGGGSRVESAQALLPPAEAENVPAPDASLGPSPPSAEALLLRPLTTVTLDSAPEPRIAAQSANLQEQNQIRNLADETLGDVSRAATRVTPRSFLWAAPATRHRPLLFEQPNLERYGHHVALCRSDHLSQSALSAAHFFGGAAALPYWVGAQGTHDCVYTLGAYRPGSCNPRRLVAPRASWRGLATQAAATTGVVFLIP